MSSQRDSERRMHPTYKSWTAGISAQTKSVAKAGTVANTVFYWDI